MERFHDFYSYFLSLLTCFFHHSSLRCDQIFILGGNDDVVNVALLISGMNS
jgi:hypothetical protein